MSELKARRAYFSEDEYDKGAHKICAKVSDCGYDRRNDWWSYAFEDEVYLKSEADKVLAEKDADIAQLQAMLEERNKQIGELKKERDWLAKDRAQAYDDLEKRAQLNIKQEESIRHHKYKRCLAMAKWCCDAYDKWMMRKAKAIGLGKDGVEAYHRARRKLFHYMRWQKRWMELAEKFKEAK